MKRSRVGLAVTLAWLVACAGRGSGPPNLLPQAAAPRAVLQATSGTELPEPPVVRAVDGIAKLALIAKNNPATGEPTFEYKGTLDVVPTIVVDPGDTIDLRLKDELPNVPPPEVMPDTPALDDINLHFHGMGSSPQKPGDDVLTTLAMPGETLHYVVRVPVTQEPGLYWYHPHVHGLTSYQVGESGISGAIVVRGIEKHLPELGRMKHRLIIVRATGLGVNAEPQGGMPMATAKPQNSNKQPCLFHDGLTVTLNGVFQPNITIAPGERQFFRVVNATGHKTLKLSVDGESLELVAIDGFALDSYPGTPPTESLPYLIVPPASRAEFIVTGPASGRGKFRTLCYNSGPNGDGDPPWLLAHLVAPKRADGGDFSRRPLTVGSPQVQNVYNTTLPPPAAKRVVVFSENNKPQFFINGKMFSMKSKPMYVVHVGTVEAWHVVNVTGEVHDFHIHQLHFLVQKINGIPVTHPFWADSFVLPHRYPVGTKSVPGTLDLLMDFRSPLIRGEFLFHCHILDHEDQGMMAKIEAI